MRRLLFLAALLSLLTLSADVAAKAQDEDVPELGITLEVQYNIHGLPQGTNCDTSRVLYSTIQWTMNYDPCSPICQYQHFSDSCGTIQLNPINYQNAGMPFSFWLKSIKSLAVSGTSTYPCPSCTLVITSSEMYTGDANNDNCVNLTDWAIFANAFGTLCGGVNYDWRGDFDNDCDVDIVDFTLLKSGYGLCGPPPLVPLAPQDT